MNPNEDEIISSYIMNNDILYIEYVEESGIDKEDYIAVIEQFVAEYYMSVEDLE